MGCNQPGATSWPDERVDRLKELWAANVSSTLIAKKLTDEFGTKFTRNSVCSKAARLNLQPRKAECVERAKPAPSEPKPKAPRPPSQPLPTPEPEPPTACARLIDDLDYSRCHWPLPHKRNGEWLFCGQPARPRHGTLFVLCDKHVWSQPGQPGMFRVNPNAPRDAAARGRSFARSLRRYT